MASDDTGPERRTELDKEISLMDEGKAWVELSFMHVTSVTGADAEAWLNDLVTAGVDGLPSGKSCRSLLLSPTGHIRAEFHTVRTGDGFVLLQDPGQPEPVEGLLERYVLSSKVELADRTHRLAARLLGPGRIEVAEPGEPPPAGLENVSLEALNVRRIRHGEPAFPVDTGLSALPAEAGWETLVDFTKGCFLGQESVAKVRNLGHPPWLIVGLETSVSAGAGDPIFAAGDEVGKITSAAPARESGTAAIARIPWAERKSELFVQGMGDFVPARRISGA